ncbi:MAG: bifunctional DNA-formamidopyrimidine glycosylase/DNA-(apurinic or apyrimidinic site) lyase [Alphaproteobacteria bacterium]|nr:bifunctional DNA-formamidopyrimidine glycosylase/DNA-(apurinic or apyrimidinic site) lyase [Alphaproteobacteria bacterium]
MPELPEVETVKRGLERVIVGRRIVAAEARRPDLRWPLPAGFAERLTGQRIHGIARRAKYLLVQLGAAEPGELVWLIHLGMSGRLIHTAAGEPLPGTVTSAQAGSSGGWPLHAAHNHVEVTFDDGSVLTFNDARRFGVMDLVAADALDRHRLLKDLGPEPLSNAFNGPALAARLTGRRTSIKAALLDQRVVAGVGNIYACEALFRAGLSPRRSAYTVQRGRAEGLAASLKSVLSDAIAAGGSSLRDYVQASGELGYFQHAFAVYDREGEECPGCTCDSVVRRIVQQGRSTFYCPARQR